MPTTGCTNCLLLGPDLSWQLTAVSRTCNLPSSESFYLSLFQASNHKPRTWWHLHLMWRHCQSTWCSLSPVIKVYSRFNRLSQHRVLSGTGWPEIKSKNWRFKVQIPNAMRGLKLWTFTLPTLYKVSTESYITCGAVLCSWHTDRAESEPTFL